MRNTFVGFLFCALLLPNVAQSQQGKQIPIVNVKALDGKMVSTSSFTNSGKPIIISFWSTTCRPCIKELMAFADLYDEWATETGVKIIAVSTDDSRTVNNVRPMVKSRGWEFDIYLDTNGDLKRAMGVSDIPHLFILDGSGKIVYQHTSYTEGSELDVIAKVRELVK